MSQATPPWRVGEHLKEVFVLANTPGFLLRRFASDASVRKIAEEASASQLTEQLFALGAQDERTFDDYVLGYALLVAITLRPYPEASTALETISIPWLEMSRGLIETWNRTRKSVSASHFTIQPRPIPAEPMDITNTTTALRMSPRPSEKPLVDQQTSNSTIILGEG